MRCAPLCVSELSYLQKRASHKFGVCGYFCVRGWTANLSWISGKTGVPRNGFLTCLVSHTTGVSQHGRFSKLVPVCVFVCGCVARLSGVSQNGWLTKQKSYITCVSQNWCSSKLVYVCICVWVCRAPVWRLTEFVSHTIVVSRSWCRWKNDFARS